MAAKRTKKEENERNVVNGQYQYQQFRADCEHLFSGHFPSNPSWNMNHTPILIYEDGSFHTTKKPKQLANFKPESICFAVWPGQWKSDIFTFTVKDWMDYEENKSEDEKEVA